jgi:chemotaxis protein CheX
MQAETECKAGKPWVRKEQRQALGDVCGVIPLNCPGLSGAIVIAFYEQTLDQILIRMLGENWKVTTSLEDAAGEFMNVIYGAAKAALNSRGYSFENVLPIIVKNARNNLALQFEGASVVIPFESTAGAFWIEIYIRSEQSGNQFHFDS